MDRIKWIGVFVTILSTAFNQACLTDQDLDSALISVKFHDLLYPLDWSSHPETETNASETFKDLYEEIFITTKLQLLYHLTPFSTMIYNVWVLTSWTQNDSLMNANVLKTSVWKLPYAGLTLTIRYSWIINVWKLNFGTSIPVSENFEISYKSWPDPSYFDTVMHFPIIFIFSQ